MYQYFAIGVVSLLTACGGSGGGSSSSSEPNKTPPIPPNDYKESWVTQSEDDTCIEYEVYFESDKDSLALAGSKVGSCEKERFVGSCQTNRHNDIALPTVIYSYGTLENIADEEQLKKECAELEGTFHTGNTNVIGGDRLPLPATPSSEIRYYSITHTNVVADTQSLKLHYPFPSETGWRELGNKKTGEQATSNYTFFKYTPYVEDTVYFSVNMVTGQFSQMPSLTGKDYRCNSDRGDLIILWNSVTGVCHANSAAAINDDQIVIHKPTAQVYSTIHGYLWINYDLTAISSEEGFHGFLADTSSEEDETTNYLAGHYYPSDSMIGVPIQFDEVSSNISYAIATKNISDLDSIRLANDRYIYKFTLDQLKKGDAGEKLIFPQIDSNSFKSVYFTESGDDVFLNALYIDYFLNTKKELYKLNEDDTLTFVERLSYSSIVNIHQTKNHFVLILKNYLGYENSPVRFYNKETLQENTSLRYLLTTTSSGQYITNLNNKVIFTNDEKLIIFDDEHSHIKDTSAIHGKGLVYIQNLLEGDGWFYSLDVNGLSAKLNLLDFSNNESIVEESSTNNFTLDRALTYDRKYIQEGVGIDKENFVFKLNAQSYSKSDSIIESL